MKNPDFRIPSPCSPVISRRDFGLAVSSAVLANRPALGAPEWRVKRVGSTAQRLREKPYEKRLVRVENYLSCVQPQYPPIGMSVEKYADLLHEAGVEMQVVAASWNRGTPRYPSKMLPPHPDVHRDRLPRFLELCHERGILVLSYYPISFNKPLLKLRPEWLMRMLDNGQTPPENQGWFCFNSPFRDWLPRYLIEFLEYLDLDGFYFDDTNWGAHDNRPFHPSCCCNYCETLFGEETGLKIPTQVDFDSLTFRRFVNWRGEKLRDLFHHLARTIKSTHADTVLDFHYYSRPTSDWTDGHPLNPLGLEKVGAHFFIETHRSVRESGFLAKLARAHGSPFCVWRHVLQELAECVTSSAPYPEPFTPTLHGLAGLANGGAAVYGMFDGPMSLRAKLLKDISREIRRREKYVGGEPVKYAALHCSQQTRDFYRPSRFEPDYREVRLKPAMGAYQMLNQSHLLVDVVFDSQLDQEHLSSYRALVLSNSACLSQDQCDAVESFVRKGGLLIATHETSLFDELGVKRKNLGLSGVLGVEYRGPVKGSGAGCVSYVPQDSSLKKLGYLVSCVAEESEIKTTTAQVLATRSSLGGERPLNRFDPDTDYDSGQPTVTMNQFGKGKAIYISADVGSGYLHNPYPVLKRFVADLAARARLPLELKAPRAIEVTAFLPKSDQLHVHLLNNPTPNLPLSLTREQLRSFFYLEEVLPVHDVRIRFNDFKPRSARMPIGGQTLEVQGNSVRVPRVDLHEVIVLEV